MKPAYRLVMPIVIGISIVFAVLNSIVFFASLITQPAGTVFLGTVHYWEDYFFYLNHFYQGAHGAWLTVNRLTPEPTIPTIIYWSNILAGKVFGFFGITPVLSYNLTLIVLAVFSGISLYILLHKILRDSWLSLSAFLIAMSATSLQNRVRSDTGEMIFWPFQIWKTPHFAFDRLGGAPHQMLLTLSTYVLFTLYLSPLHKYRKLQFLMLFLTVAVITTIQPAQGAMIAAVLTAGEIIRFLISRKVDIANLRKLAVLIGTVATLSLYMLRLFTLAPHVQTKVWEASQQSLTVPLFLLKSIGPVTVLAVIGVLSRISRFSAVEWSGLLLILGGYAMFLSPLPKLIGISNVRLLFPAAYAFWGLFAAYGINYLSRRLAGKTRISASGLAAILTGFFLLISLPTLVWEVNMKLKVLENPSDPMLFLPTPVYAGFMTLEKSGIYDDIVMANPASHMDSLIPALSGHTVWSGHLLATTDNGIRQQEAADFFSGNLNPAGTAGWLKQRNIRYILFTVYDGDRQQFRRNYPFLKVVDQNSGYAVYEVLY